MAQNPLLDPKTGDYVQSGGDFVQTDSLEIPAYFRLKAKRTQWLYAPNTDWGSDFYLVKKRRSNDNASQVESIGARALQPMVDDGRAAQITVNAVTVTRNSVGLQADIEDLRGKPQTLVLPEI